MSKTKGLKLKILFILHKPPPVHGSSMMGRYIMESSIINQSYDCNYINLSTSLTVDEIGKNSFIKIVRYLSIVAQVLKQLITNKPQLCYLAITAKGLAFYKDSLIALLVKSFGVRLVYHFHNKGVSTKQHKFIDNLLYLIVFKNTDAILLSKHLYPDIQKYFPTTRVLYCPNGIPDIDNSQIIQDKRQKKTDKTVKILFLSNLIESKGVFALLEACKILQQKGILFNCTFVGGEGNIKAQHFQQKVNDLGLEEQVIYIGKKYGKDKEEAFSNADIFAFPTYYDNECFPLVLLEAMKHRLPVISTFEGGIPDVVENGVTGFLVPQKDAKALSEKLELLIKNPELRSQLGRAARLKHEREFTLKIFEQKLSNIICNLVNQTI